MLEREGRVEFLPEFARWIEAASRPDIVTILTADTEVVWASSDFQKRFMATLQYA